ncbi:MAG: glycoside hydrolase family 3 protein [Candidatus Paceibacterota bacterium]
MNAKKHLKILGTAIILFAACAAAFTVYAAASSEKKDAELKKKIGQMLIIGFRGAEINKDSYIVKTINELNIGGVILFDKDSPSKGEIQRNIVDPKQTKTLIANLKQNSSASLFVAIDAEGGYVNRLKTKYGFFSIPSAETLGKGSLEKTEQAGELLGQELAAMGFNMDFAPVVDVNINPANPVIGYLERSFSSDPSTVASYAKSFIKGLHSYGIVTAIKHFPGHGSSTADSHLGMVDVTKTWSPKELIPYVELIKGGYSDLVMTAHIVNTAIDPNYPATLSPLFIKNLLRNGLQFKGLVVSDDMQMGAIVDNYGFNDALVRAVNSGCDILILSNNIKTYNEQVPYDAVNALFVAVKNGQISEQRINESYDRIQQFKKDHGI